MKIIHSSAIFAFLSALFILGSCQRATEDPYAEESIPPTLQVISPDNGEVFYTSEGPRRQADLHFISSDDTTIDYTRIIVTNSAGTEVYNNRDIMRNTTLTYEMFRNFSTTEAGQYTVHFIVADTAGNMDSEERTIIFEDRVPTDEASTAN